MKKKIILAGTILLSTFVVKAQTIFNESFDASSNLPANWTMYNEDGLTSVYTAYTSSAWVISTVDAAYGKSATSTSYYNPAGQSNDWLVTPQISIPATGQYFLQLEAKAKSSSYADGFEVYVSTTGNTVNDFTGTPNLSIAAATTSWVRQSIDLSAFAGQNVYIAIRNHSNDKDKLYIDNVVVRQLPQNEAILNSVSLNRYGLISTNNSLVINVKNDGINTITGLTLNWNDGTDHIQNVTTSIAAGQTVAVTHPTPLNYSSIVEKNIAVTITQVNGSSDAIPSNNVGSVRFNTISSNSTKKVVFEEGTGTWCGFCVRGAVAMEYMNHNYENFIGIAVHNNDPMTVAEYDDSISNILTGYPSSNIDRAIFKSGVSNSQWETVYNQRKDLPVPAAVSLNVTTSGSDVTIDASTVFKTSFTNPNFRLAVVILEDSIIGTDAGYDQHNYYAGGSMGALTDVNGLDYTALPSTIPHETYKFNHVARAIIGGYQGLQGSVSSTINDGTVSSHTFNYSVPVGSNINNMKAVVLLIDQQTREIVNAAEKKLSSSSSLSSIQDDFKLNVFPNPASEIVNIELDSKITDCELLISDLNGKEVYSNFYSNLVGQHVISVPVNHLNKGSYLVTITSKNNSYTKHLEIN